MLAMVKGKTEHVPMNRCGPVSNRDSVTWSLPEGAVARLGRGKITDMAFLLDGECLAVTTDIGLWWYELTTMQPVALSETERGMVSAISCSPNGQRIATGNADGIVKIWEIQSQQCVLETGQRMLNHGIRQLIFSPDGYYLAASRSRAPISVWCAETGESIVEYPIEVRKAAGRMFYPICFSPNGTLLAYMSSEDTVSVMHLETSTSIARFTIHSARVARLIFSPCGQFLAASIQIKTGDRRNARIHVWNVHRGISEETPTKYGGYLAIPTYSPESTLKVADIHNDKVIIWNVDQSEKLGIFKHHGATRASRFSSDGQQFAIASSCNFHLWRESTPKIVAPLGHPGHSNSVVFTQQGRTLVSGHSEGSGIVFWNVAQKRAKQTLPANTELYYGKRWLAMSPSEEFLATNSFKTIEVWCVASGTHIATFTEPQSVGALAFSPTGKRFVSTMEDGALYVWDVSSWEKRYTLIGHTRFIRALAFHPDGRVLVSASEDKTARVWDVARGSFVTSLSLAPPLSPNLYKGNKKKIERVLKVGANEQKGHAREIWDITFSACGTFLAGGIANEIRLWDGTTYKTQMVILPPQGCERPFALVFSPCSQYLVSGSWWLPGRDKVSIRLWDVTTGENVHTFWGHPTDIQDLAFSPDGTLLASGSFDGTILLWDVTSYLQQNEKS